MSAAMRLAGFAVLLVLALGGGAVIGDAVGPEPERDAPMVERDVHETGRRS